MNPSLPAFNPAADEQASLWAARLDGSVLSAGERVALDAWLACDPVHRELLSQYCQFSADLEQRLPALVAAHAIDLPPVGIRRRAAWGGWAAGLALAAAAAVAVIFWPGRPASQRQDRATPAGQRQSLTLADGSMIDLNAQTNIQIEITGHSRQVRLAAGEAFFVVHKDPSRPFVVETPAGSVRVTGTKFDVRADRDGQFEVTVLEGSVQTHPLGAGGTPAAPRALAPGDQLSASPAGVEVRKLTPAEVEDAVAWRQGQIVFNGVPLRDALARFARYHGRGIIVAPEVADRRVGGRYSLDDLDGFFSFIEEGLQVRVTRELNGTVRVSARSVR
ncbi:MAG: FecR domain-containing protein [Verrucomicrobia bacterium]|nr:FecR domain-containing protein [Verrucomicrobiota bacterium]